MKKQKFYVVWNGRRTGIFTTWEQCEVQVKGFPSAKYKSFENIVAAEEAYKRNYEVDLVQQHSRPKLIESALRSSPIIPSYCVDASCIGNPGILEYRCVRTETGELIFAKGPFEYGTNNVGEFLAIVHALVFFKEKRIGLPIYTDSRNGISWIYKRKCKTTLCRSERSSALFELVDSAENWLKNNSYQNKVLKWDTRAWGQIPADYRRK
jgi:ribonuclease HI